MFVRSGIRFDYLMYDKDHAKFLDQLAAHHVSGQLKVAPEHCANHTLMMMGKPRIEVYERFRDAYFRASAKAGREQYLVPYLMSSHPGTTLSDAVDMALWLRRFNYSPEQVQDFYPTPGTISTAMYYTGLHPMTEKPVAVCRDYHEKAMQRALLQYKKPENASLVREALTKAGRCDLIGYTADCLVRPAAGGRTQKTPPRTERGGKKAAGRQKPSASRTTRTTRPRQKKKKR